jgi:hypothetical protein
MSPHHATFQEALRALDLLMGWRVPWASWMPVEGRREGRTALWWHKTGDGRVLAESVQRCDELYSDEIVLRLPEPVRFNGGPVGASILWCRIEGTDQLKRARAFRPLPTMVIQEGSSSRRLLIWALREWADYFLVEQMNKRIAYRLRAVQKWGRPERLEVPCPGTCLRVGRSRPIPVVVGRLTTDVYTAKAVAGRLREPPPQRMPWEVAA